MLDGGEEGKVMSAVEVEVTGGEEAEREVVRGRRVGGERVRRRGEKEEVEEEGVVLVSGAEGTEGRFFFCGCLGCSCFCCCFCCCASCGS